MATLSEKDLQDTGQLRARCSEALKCSAHGEPLPCLECADNGESYAPCCARCGVLFKEAEIPAGGVRDCQSGKIYRDTGKVSFDPDPEILEERRRHLEAEREIDRERRARRTPAGPTPTAAPSAAVPAPVRRRRRSPAAPPGGSYYSPKATSSPASPTAPVASVAPSMPRFSIHWRLWVGLLALCFIGYLIITNKSLPASTEASPNTQQQITTVEKDVPKNPVPSETPVIAVQLGIFSNLDVAKRDQQAIAELGIRSYVTKFTTSSGIKFRLRCGPFSTEAEALNALSVLKQYGMAGALVDVKWSEDEPNVEAIHEPAQAAKPVNKSTSQELTVDMVQASSSNDATVTKPRLGIKIIDNEYHNMILVEYVEPNSLAATAGVQAGDGITYLDGKYVSNTSDFLEIMSTFKHGGVYELGYGQISQDGAKLENLNRVKIHFNGTNKAAQSAVTSGEAQSMDNFQAMFQGAFGRVVEKRSYPSEEMKLRALGLWAAEWKILEPDGTINEKYVVKPKFNPLLGH